MCYPAGHCVFVDVKFHGILDKKYFIWHFLLRVFRSVSWIEYSSMIISETNSDYYMIGWHNKFAVFIYSFNT
jgi:hypothetical protein